METPSNGEATTRLIDERLLASPVMAQEFLKRSVIIAVDGTQPSIYQVRLTVIAGDLDTQKLKEDLYVALSSVLGNVERYIPRPWAREVVFDDAENVMVKIKNPYLLRSESSARVLDAVRVGLTPTIARMEHRLFTLDAGERLVPLICHWQVEDNSLIIPLPDSLTFTQPMYVSVGGDVEQDQKNLVFLKAGLLVALNLFKFKDLEVCKTYIAVRFNQIDAPTAEVLQNLEYQIFTTLQQHAMPPYGSTYQKLVFVPATVHQASKKDYPAP